MSVRTSLARSAAAGALLANAVPHGIAGLVGRPFPTPFADPPGEGLSGRGPNLAWSAANAAFGLALLRGRDRAAHDTAVLGQFGAATAVALAAYFGRLDLTVPQT